MKHRQSERSTQSLKPGDGVPGAMMVRGLKDTSSRPAKDLGEPCGIREKRCCGVMTALPGAACYVPIVRGAWQMWRTIQTESQQPYRTVSGGNCRPDLSIRLLFNNRVKTVFEWRCVYMTKQTTPTTSYKEVRIGKTIYRVTSFFREKRIWERRWNSWQSDAQCRKLFQLPAVPSNNQPRGLPFLACRLGRCF